MVVNRELVARIIRPSSTSLNQYDGPEDENRNPSTTNRAAATQLK
jgi:hypothetical protein